MFSFDPGSFPLLIALLLLIRYNKNRHIVKNMVEEEGHAIWTKI